LFVLQEKAQTTGGIAVTPDDRYIISALDDNTLTVWDLERGRALRTLRGHVSTINSVAVTRDGKHVISVSDDHTLRVWKLANGETVAVFRGEGSLSICAVVEDGTILAGETSGRVHFLRLEEFEV
jgi:WD40 repeat protein